MSVRDFVPRRDIALLFAAFCLSNGEGGSLSGRRRPARSRRRAVAAAARSDPSLVRSAHSSRGPRLL